MTVAIRVETVPDGSDPQGSVGSLPQKTDGGIDFRQMLKLGVIGRFATQSMQSRNRTHPEGLVCSLKNRLDPVLAGLALKPKFPRLTSFQAQKPRSPHPKAAAIVFVNRVDRQQGKRGGIIHPLDAIA